MFNHKEYLRFFEKQFYRQAEQIHGALLFDWLPQFDSCLRAFESDCGGCPPPETYWTKGDAYPYWHDQQYKACEISCQIHFYYGMRLFRRGTQLAFLAKIPVIPEEQLRENPQYRALAEASDAIFAQARQEGAVQNDMEQWCRYYQCRHAVYARSYLWAGFLTAQREAEAANTYEACFPQ